MKIGIIGAMKEEIAHILEHTKKIKDEKIANLLFYQLEYQNNEIFLVESGIGKVNASIASSILIIYYRVDLIISTGIAGGMSPLNTRDICLIDSLYYGDVDATVFGYQFGQVPGEELGYNVNDTILNKAKNILNNKGYKYQICHALTSDKFVTTLGQLPKDGVFCFEMESTAIAQTASHFNVPFLVIRYISDIVGAKSQIANYEQFEDEIALNSSLITLDLVGEL